MDVHNTAPQRAILTGSQYRKGLRRKLAAFIAASAITLGVVGTVGGLASPATAASDQTDATLNAALIGDIDSLNPFLSVLSNGIDILTFTYEPLVQFAAKDNTDSAGMADSWTTSDDGTVWTYKFDPNAKWSDGTPITAQDAAWTYNAIIENDPLKQAYGSFIENFAKVEASDDTTLTITLKEPQAANPGTDVPMVPEHIWSKVDAATFKNDKDVVGSGPFTIKNYDKTSGVQLIRNDNYREGPAQIAKINYAPYKSTDAAVQALKSGEIDILSDLTPAQFEALKSDKNITTIAADGRRYQAMDINPGAKDVTGAPMGNGAVVLQDEAFRRAIIRGVDRNTLLEKVKQGLGTPGTGLIPPVYPQFHWETDPNTLPLSFDPQAAKDMLDKAGYKLDANGNRLDKEGKPITLRLLGRSTEPSHQLMIDYIKPWMKDLGIEVKSEVKQSAQVNDDTTLGNYDMYFTGWGQGPDPDFQLSINQCSSRPNSDGTGATSQSNWCDPAFDELYKRQHAELDPVKRAALVQEAQELLYNSAANNILYYANSLQAYRSDRFEPFQQQPDGVGPVLSQNGPWGLYSATPKATTSSSGESSGSPATIWWIVGGAVVVGAALTVVVSRRRSRLADEQE